MENSTNVPKHRDKLLKVDLGNAIVQSQEYGDEVVGIFATISAICNSDVVLEPRAQQCLRTLRSKVHDLLAQQAHLIESWHQVNESYLSDSLAESEVVS